jgi:hypothetical protein
MNDSDSRAPSSTKITDLKEILQQKEAEREAQAQAAADQAFQSFETSLSSSLSAVESTLRAGIAGLRSALQSQQDALQKQILRDTPRLLFLLRIPLLATVLLCLALIGLTWLWMPRELWNVHTFRAPMNDHRTYLVIEDPAWKTCTMSDGRELPCKTLEREKSQTPAPRLAPAARHKPKKTSQEQPEPTPPAAVSDQD